MNRSMKEVGRVLLVVTAFVVWTLSGVGDVSAGQTAGGLEQQIQGKVLASSEQSPPTSEQAKRIEAMVNKAATLVESQGKAAFSEFRKSDSEWWFGNTYLFAYDQNLNVLLNPAFPKREEDQSSRPERCQRQGIS